MARSQLADIRQKLQQGHQETLQLINSIDEQTAHRRVRFDAWSVKDHVAHLGVVQETVIRFARRILNEDYPVSSLCYDKTFDRDAWNIRQVAERAGYSWADVVSTLKETHQDLLTLLDHIPEESLYKVGSHPVWGTPVTLASVLRVPYRHERAHRDEIAALYSLP